MQIFMDDQERLQLKQTVKYLFVSISADREKIISSLIHFVLPEATISNSFPIVFRPVLFNALIFL